MRIAEHILSRFNESVKDSIKKRYNIDDSAFEKISPDHVVCSIAKTKDGWVGFSHRACCEFVPGEDKMIFDPKWNDGGKLSEKELDNMSFIKRGDKPMKTMDDAKIAAINFAAHVS